MLHAAPLAAPQDLAWFLASYARDARLRIEGVELQALTAVRAALEQALGLAFQGERGEHFFRSTLVQTLFYGVFSAWVLWSKDHAPESAARFNWHEAAYLLRVPMISALFEQVALPSKLEPLGLVEVLDWAGAALNRVGRAAFFARFEEGHAVQYFYEPFLKAFDPRLREQLGVWYTPPEIVRYMVARVDTALREELGLVDGLADPNVYVLDPCCGTGTYLVEVLKHIAATLRARGDDALGAYQLKRAAMERVFGFELLPAPFVVAHLQLGLLLRNAGAPLSEAAHERAGVYLTNALTGWEPPSGPQQHLPFPGLEEERDAAGEVKRARPILVILGNPPYNGYAGMAIGEERDLSTAYRTAKAVKQPQGQGLNDLYVRFFRMAERRIVEKSGRGVVCYISNYSWLDGLSFTAMRERYLEAFDHIWIDCLNGDKYKTGKLTPEGAPDPSIFSTEWNREGIQVGTAIALLVRHGDHAPAETVRFRHLWGRNKRAELLETATQRRDDLYHAVAPPRDLGLPFMPMRSEGGYLRWPLLPDLFPVSFPGVKTSRDDVVVDIDKDRLIQRMRHYFDPAISHEEMRRLAPGAMESVAGFKAESARDYLRRRGFLSEHVVRYCYQPFDVRWLYWEPETRLLDRKRADLFLSFHTGNFFLTSRQKGERSTEGTPFYVTSHLPDWHLTRPGSVCFPLMIDDGPSQQDTPLFDAFTPAKGPRANLSGAARIYLATLAIDPDADADTSELIWMHTLAIGHSITYLGENAGGLSQDWPRVPLPESAEALRASAELGRRVAALLDTERPVSGVTAGSLRAELRAIGALARVGGGQLNPDAGDLELRAGWGHAGNGGVTMPGKGRAVERDYTPQERAAIAEGAEALGLSAEQVLDCLGATTYDVYLNGVALWRDVPAGVWSYTIGGYQVMKKWLSYREYALLGRGLSADEVDEVTAMARRIAALLLLTPALDANYQRAKAGAVAWPPGAEAPAAR